MDNEFKNWTVTGRYLHVAKYRNGWAAFELEIRQTPGQPQREEVVRLFSPTRHRKAAEAAAAAEGERLGLEVK